MIRTGHVMTRPNSKIILEPNRKNIKLAARSLLNGSLVGLPTETVYGIAADAMNDSAVKRIFMVKNRPVGHPLIVHISKIEYLDFWTNDQLSAPAQKLIEKFWPGPITIVLKKSSKISDQITGFQNTVAIRMPANLIATNLLNEFHDFGGFGVVAPSANRFGAVSATDAFSVIEELGNYLDVDRDLVLNGGYCRFGIESTIIDCSNSIPVILRPGIISSEKISRVLGYEIHIGENRIAPKHSGMHEKHYSPKARVFLNSEATQGSGFIALSKIATPKNCIRLASPHTSLDFARIIYSSLRKADQLGLPEVFVNIPIDSDLTEAIYDRLYRASRDSSL